MEGSSFWLIYIQENQVSVSLISISEGKFQIVATGPKKNWNQNEDDSLTKSVDESLSIASINANITEEEEPENAAFVVPPFWVGSDGKILPQKLNSIKKVCKKISLIPTGFLAEDEAIVEDTNKEDDFPSSFILVHLDNQEFYLSLVYLGHIKERIKKNYDGEFNGQILESTLLEIKTESTLPPRILFFGQSDNQIIASLKDYPWIGKKNIETFLHLPDINFYNDNDLITIFTRVISSQISGNFSQTKTDDNIILSSKEDITPEVELPSPLNSEAELVETAPEDFGFTTEQEESQSSLITDHVSDPNLDPQEPEPNLDNNKKISMNLLKKIKIPKIRINFNLFWIVLIILPFLAILPFIFLPADITLFITPYQFEKTVSVTLKTDATEDDISSSIIPVQKETFNVDAQATVETTGEKTVGNQATGEVIIYNKVDETQSIPKGSVLIDSSGKKFELSAAVSVAASTSSFNDEDNLVTVSGQSKSSAIAADIGSEYNISSGSQLTFEDYPSTSLIAKVETGFSGGSKQQIKAVSKEDKAEIQSKIDDEIINVVEEKINQTLNNVSGVIKESIQSDQGILDLSREVGEAADELSGTVTASVSVFTLSSSVKEKLLKQFLSDDPNFDKIEFDLADFDLNFEIKKITSTQATSSLTIIGKSLPKIDVVSLQKALSVKTIKQAGETIKKILPRAYNFNIGTKLPLLPFNSQNINIEIKTEN